MAKNSHKRAILTVPKVPLMICASYNAASLIWRHETMRGQWIMPGQELPWLQVPGREENGKNLAQTCDSYHSKNVVDVFCLVRWHLTRSEAWNDEGATDQASTWFAMAASGIIMVSWICCGGGPIQNLRTAGNSSACETREGQTVLILCWELPVHYYDLLGTFCVTSHG